MSKYTTEVRFICETSAGLNESAGASNVDDVIDKSWDKIFTSKVPFFDENYRKVICKKILKHFYLREICCETVGIWKLWMNERLEMVMPYYNKLYESELLKFDPFNDVNVTRKHDRNVGEVEKKTTDTTQNTTGKTDSSGTNKNNSSESGKSSGNSTSTSVSRNLYSDTPQGGVNGLEDEVYLTNARKVSDNDSGTVNNTNESTKSVTGEYTDSVNNTSAITGKNTVNGSVDTTEDFLESVIGKQGGASYSKMLAEYRDTFLNIDMLLVNEFSDLFFGLW